MLNYPVRFVDEVEIQVRAGDGGNGCVAFRREKFLPLGGPSGGDGGRGGDVVLQANRGLHTLLDLQYRREIRAARGEHGRGRDQYGKQGAGQLLQVPTGTVIIDAGSEEPLGELVHHGDTLVVATGGRGGRGNMRFATPYDKAPRRAEDGHPGERKKLRLELKLICDVGIVGFPNVGKSTLVSVLSRAKPKIADYPFTTLVPTLGVVPAGDHHSLVMADIPGIIEGASEGAGLGLRFLRHAERSKVLLHLVTVSDEPGRDPLDDVQTLDEELKAFSPELSARPQLVALAQADRPEVERAFARFEAQMAKLGRPTMLLSAINRSNLDTLVHRLWRMLNAEND